MGMGATNTIDRVAASVGLLCEVGLEFKPAVDVSGAGVLFALPALLACGLLLHARKYFNLPKGYYGLESLLMLLAFMALGRVKSVEALRYLPPGEWGKFLGLDRIPEARTLRNKIKLLAQQGDVAGWEAKLCESWMQEASDTIGVFYIDGHVRVYYGSQTKLPRHYVSRERLCLRATTDYWVNTMDGRPFFYVNKAVDPGLLNVLENDIVPQLNQYIPKLPDAEYSQEPGDLAKPRFTLICDREGYSPETMQRQRAQGIACMTYHKYPGANWPEDEFQRVQVTLISGEQVYMDLAWRGVMVGGSKVWMHEIRRLTQSGHQTSILTTHEGLSIVDIAKWMFARWCQENFFRYMRQHYGLDRLVDYCLDDIPESTRVVNPAHREIDGTVRKQVGVLQRKRAQYGALRIQGDIEQSNVEPYEHKKAELQQEITELEHEVEQLKQKRRETQRHITISELSEEQRFKALSTDSKYFVDTVKMVAYRAETAMVSMLRPHVHKDDDVRSLLRAIYSNEADLIPNDKEMTLTVHLHHLANRAETELLKNLCDELNATQTIYPGTKYRLIYQVGSSNSANATSVP
jgi:hypothetical protein